MTPTDGEGEWIADPLDAAISILISIPGMAAATTNVRFSWQSGGDQPLLAMRTRLRSMR